MTDDDERVAIEVLEKQYAHQLSLGVKWLGIGVCAGWIPIVRGLLESVDSELAADELRHLRWVQIKQKFGELRAYYDLANRKSQSHVDLVMPGEHVHLVTGAKSALATKVDALIARAAHEASRTCEICGAPGEKVNNGGWIMVGCPAHRGAPLSARAHP